MCARSGRNAAIFCAEDGVLQYAGGHFHDTGVVTCIKLAGNGVKRVRSHFERLAPAVLFHPTLPAAEREIPPKKIRESVAEKVEQAEAPQAKRRRNVATERFVAEADALFDQNEAWILKALAEEAGIEESDGEREVSPENCKFISSSLL